MLFRSIGITHDVFSNEKNFIKPAQIDEIINGLHKKDLIYKEDGATWYKTTSLGKEQDRVLIKSTGEPAYRLPDIVYHCDKFERKYDLLIDIFGADHIDSYPDVVSALKALEYDTSNLRVLIHQFVTLTKSGEKVKMSTRKAEFVTLDELINLVGKDVVRYFFLMRGMNTHLNFDLELAQDQSEKNPVFYLQYAHARICSVLRQLQEKKIDYDQSLALKNLSLLKETHEQQLMTQLSKFPEIIDMAADNYEAHHVAHYLRELANDFHTYYNAHQFIVDDENLRNARLALILAAKQVFVNGLGILGVSARESM